MPDAPANRAHPRFVSEHPPGYFAGCYDAEEIRESNELARRSIRKVVP